MLVQDAMTKSPVVCAADTPLREVVALFRKHHIGGLPVMEGKELVGIITDADLRRSLTRRGPSALAQPTGDLMSRGCKRVRESTLASEAMAIFHQYRIDELPVVDDQDQPVGLIDVQDIVALKIGG